MSSRICNCFPADGVVYTRGNNASKSYFNCQGKKLVSHGNSVLVTMSQHPKYADMILAAVKALGGKGASRQAINKYVVKEYNLTENKHHLAMLNQALKRCSGSKGHLVHSKGQGAAGSFKVRAAEAKPKKADAKPKENKKKPANKSPKKASPEKPKENKPESKPEQASKPSKEKKTKKSKAASPKKPKAVKAKNALKKATRKRVASKK